MHQNAQIVEHLLPVLGVLVDLSRVGLEAWFLQEKMEYVKQREPSLSVLVKLSCLHHAR